MPPSDRALSGALDRLLETSRILEPIAGALGACVGLVLAHFHPFRVGDKAALYGSMATCSTGLMAVSVIAVNLASALSPSSIRVRLAESARQFSNASFSSVLGLLTSAAVAFALFLVQGKSDGLVRYALCGGWAGLVGTASFRSLVLGRRLLETSLRSKVGQ